MLVVLVVAILLAYNTKINQKKEGRRRKRVKYEKELEMKKNQENYQR